MHLQRGGIDKISRTDEFVVKVVLPQDLADILAKETLDALSEFLDPVDILLRDASCPVGGIGRPGVELLDLPLHTEIPRDVRHQILDERKCPHRLYGRGLLEREVAQAG